MIWQKEKIMKRIFTLLVLLTVVATGWAQYVEIGGISYNLNRTDMTAEVTSKSPIYKGVIVIPASVTNGGVKYSVTSIESSAFYGCSGLTSVTIPNSVTSIGDYAFYNCSGLTSVTIPNSVTSIGDYAFGYCFDLTSVTIPNSVTSIGSEAFYYCSGLTSVTIPNSVTSIGARAFRGCSGLTSVTIPNSVTSIGTDAFYQCSGLPVIDGVRYADTYLEGLVDKSLTDVKIKEGTRFIGSSAFYYCSGLTSMTIPNSVTSIGKNAFDGCSGLTSVTIPNSVTSIESYAFRDCSGLPVIDGLRYADTYLVELVDKSLTDVKIKEGTRFIGTNAFLQCSGLTSVDIPNSVTSIGVWAFYGCSGLTSVTDLAETPQDIFSETFTTYGTLHVLPGCGDAYRTANYWKNFTIIEDAVLPPNDIALFDGQVFEHSSEETYDNLTYTRNFTNTEWQALYVPFAMSYEDWAGDFEVLRLNAVHQYDDDDNGTDDRTELEAIKVKSGSIEPNTPYLIRAKEVGEKVITLTDATLYPAVENKFDVTSWNTKFTFTGTYSGISGTEMKTNGYYAMGGGALARAKTESANLGAFRWYLSVTDRMGNPKDVNEVKVTVFGLDWDGEETAIEGIRSNVQTSSVFDMSGRKAQQNTLRSGLYIKNGKKYLVK